MMGGDGGGGGSGGGGSGSSSSRLDATAGPDCQPDNSAECRTV